MSTVTRPRRPLPKRVYWTRRVLVLVLALGLVFGIAHLLGTGGASTSTARPVGATASPDSSAPGSTANAAPSAGGGTHRKGRSARASKAAKARASKTVTPLAVPTGPCDARDVRVMPGVVGTAHAGSPVTFELTLRTVESPACTWTVSPSTLVVKLTSGTDRIWSTQDCKGAVPDESVVVRKDHDASVQLTWRGQRSDATCSRTTSWAQPGFYHIEAAALGAEPTDVQFELCDPAPVTITPSPTAEPSKKSHGKSGARPGSSGAGSAGDDSSAKPSAGATSGRSTEKSRSAGAGSTAD
jgi:hypothetical protein